MAMALVHVLHVLHVHELHVFARMAQTWLNIHKIQESLEIYTVDLPVKEAHYL